ncbi:hypothetical protein TNCT_324701 [Trichonephila clavata]|uniref:Uncharacterized protein n=1 Tax=Trichonephila clavata TaxID=2740835 RepID=A0A8X6LS24_TRICU|nr:hypothetical protein TNCT_324701 [Trichonephila clavata]
METTAVNSIPAAFYLITSAYFFLLTLELTNLVSHAARIKGERDTIPSLFKTIFYPNIKHQIMTKDSPVAAEVQITNKENFLLKQNLNDAVRYLLTLVYVGLVLHFWSKREKV